ncbi:MAG: Re/Si-specific NAD(P)(+) transhydrogenase subunit alpha [Rhodospirillales bacterium]|nr:Re/Si-specific NAD(P)(+) transhydrogenase subunit alpha [Rhodospirillales bacterium]MDH3966898.1 Re/Si-specific NAD(P)(+) transhydrogenase subunit alpha [Rhodospirillales bacterium]
MKIAIPKERRPHESRVAASPETVKKLTALGCKVVVEKGAGAGAAITDSAYRDAGASIADDQKSALTEAEIVLKVQRPEAKDLALIGKGAVVVSIMDPYRAGADLAALAGAGVTSFAMDLMPRITRAQTMDVLSSQSNLAGYKAVLDAAAEFGSAFPMMMTAAGTIPPARVLVMGAGVAGLQAIATARRLGAIVSATDVRPAAKEQVESLGASFVAVEDEEFKEAETAGGYAKEMSDAYKEKQAQLIAETIPKQNIVITTALIPGRPAPRLVSAYMVASMKPGSVIVDLAVEAGGNCELSEPGKVVAKHDVKVIGHYNVPSRLAADASRLYARNLFNFLELMIDKDSGALAIDWDDEIIKGTCVTHNGEVVNPDLAKLSAAAPAPAPEAAPESGAEAAPKAKAKPKPKAKAKPKSKTGGKGGEA